MRSQLTNTTQRNVLVQNQVRHVVAVRDTLRIAHFVRHFFRHAFAAAARYSAPAMRSMKPAMVGAVCPQPALGWTMSDSRGLQSDEPTRRWRRISPALRRTA